MIQQPNCINYPYATIKMTQSRIDKGLIAIPMSFAQWFPQKNTTLNIYLGNTDILHPKNYSSYLSNTRECRIGGMAQWFKEEQIDDGDEIVIQQMDEQNLIYRIIGEKNFIRQTQKLQMALDHSQGETDAFDSLKKISHWTTATQKDVILNEFYRLVHKPITKRLKNHKSATNANESVPANMRLLLERIYQGRCQVCDFFFLKKNQRPYYEVHHIDASKNHHPINLLVVCANCHRQFTYAPLEQYFDEEHWLTQVKFNEKKYEIHQIVKQVPYPKHLKQIFI